MKSYEELLAIKNEKIEEDMLKLQPIIAKGIANARISDSDNKTLFIIIPKTVTYEKRYEIGIAIENEYNKNTKFGVPIRYDYNRVESNGNYLYCFEIRKETSCSII